MSLVHNIPFQTYFFNITKEEELNWNIALKKEDNSVTVMLTLNIII